MNIKQISTTARETIYEVNGHELRLWIITGGTPALSFNNYTYRKLYPDVKYKWSDQHWQKDLRCYIHQNPKHLQGPTFDVLPKGEESIAEYLETYLPKKQLCEKRVRGLPKYFKDTVTSPRVHDKDNRTYAFASIRIDNYHLSTVGIHSKNYGGRIEEKINLFSDWWVRAQAVFNPIYDKHRESRMDLEMDGLTWDCLTEEEYTAIVKILSEKS